MTAALFFPFYWNIGPDIFGFFLFHKDRGLHVESLGGSLVSFVGCFDQAPTFSFSYGCYQSHSLLSDHVAGLATWFTLCGLLTAAGAFVCRVSRLPNPKVGVRPGATLAQTYPHCFVQFTLLFLLIFIVCNKVFSPQYLLWVTPLVCLVPWNGKVKTIPVFLFLATCELTFLIFPYYFTTEIVGGMDDSGLHPGPTRLGLTLLLTRNLLVAALLLCVFLDLKPEEALPQTT